MNVLFVCSRNQWRSPTAEQIFRRGYGIAVRSAGTARSARHQINPQDIQWATLICVMEDHHRQRLYATYRALLQHKRVVVLDIPDDYQYMDGELIALLMQSMRPYLPSES